MDNSHHNPTLREQLDAVRPDSDDLREPDVQEAARAIVTSDEWKHVFGRQQTIDRELTTAMQDVDVPEGLQSRLLDALKADASFTTDSMAAPDVARVAPSRRVWNRTVLAVAAMFLATGLGWLILPHGPATLTLDDVRQSLPFAGGTINTQALTAFDDSFAAPLPSHKWSNWQIANVKGLDLDGNGTHDAALYEFTVRGTHGYLLVLPTARISDPPTRTFFSTADISYEPVTNVAWTIPADEVVYLCLIDRGQPNTLSRLLTPAAA